MAADWILSKCGCVVCEIRDVVRLLKLAETVQVYGAAIATEKMTNAAQSVRGRRNSQRHACQEYIAVKNPDGWSCGIIVQGEWGTGMWVNVSRQHVSDPRANLPDSLIILRRTTISSKCTLWLRSGDTEGSLDLKLGCSFGTAALLPQSPVSKISPKTLWGILGPVHRVVLVRSPNPSVRSLSVLLA